MFIIHIKIIIIYILYGLQTTLSTGSIIFQCPDGHYISTFNTAYVGHERYYKFSCARFSNIYSVSYSFFI